MILLFLLEVRFTDKGEPQNETTHFFDVDDMSPVLATEPVSARLTPTVTRGATIRTFTKAITIATVWRECLNEALAQVLSHQELIRRRAFRAEAQLKEKRAAKSKQSAGEKAAIIKESVS